MSRLRHLATALAAVCLAAAAEAGPTASSRNVTATLVSDVSAVQPGQPFHLGVRLRMAPEWHTYWRNPGDSGLPTKIAWTLPEGFTTADLLWPRPDRFLLGPLGSYGYHDEVILLAEVTPPAKIDAASVPVAAKVSWLECKDVCLPGKAQLDVTLPVAATAAPSADAAAITATLARVPRPDADGKVTARAATGQLQVAFSPAAGAAYFFPFASNLVQYAAEPHVATESGATTLTMALDANAQVPERLQGVLVWDPASKDARAVEIDVALAGGGAAYVPGPAPAMPVADTAGGGPTTVGLTGNVSTLPMALLFAFVGGLILNLMPCVLPVLSLKVLSFVRHAGNDPAHAWRHGVAFAVGVVLSFWALAGVLLALRAAGEQIGWGFQLQSPSFLVVLAGLFFLMGLNLFGVFEVGASLTAAGGYAARHTGLAGSFWGGALATLVATPCTAPFMGSALGFALAQPAFVALLTFTALGLGMAFPYVLLSLFPRLLRFVPKPGAWMVGFKQLMGFLLMATVVALLWLFGQHAGTTGMTALLGGLLLMAVGAWLYGRYDSELSSRPVRLASVAGAALLVACGLVLGLSKAQAATPADAPKTHVSGGIPWEPWSPPRVEQLRAEGRPVFVDFTAAWCLTCQVNERTALASDVVVARLREANVATLKADWTHKDETITQALAGFGRQGVPLYVLYPPRAAQPVLLPELLTPDVVIDALSKIQETR